VNGGPGRALFAWRPEPAPAGTAAVATIGLLGLGAAVLAAFVLRHHPVPFALDFRETPFYGPSEVSTHLSTIKHFFDARGQSLGHLAMTLAVALLTFLGMTLGVRRDIGGRLAPGLVAFATVCAWHFLPGPRGIAYAGALLLLTEPRPKAEPPRIRVSASAWAPGPGRSPLIGPGFSLSIAGTY